MKTTPHEVRCKVGDSALQNITALEVEQERAGRWRASVTHYPDGYPAETIKIHRKWKTVTFRAHHGGVRFVRRAIIYSVDVDSRKGVTLHLTSSNPKRWMRHDD